MVLCGRGVLAVALDARHPSLWTSVADRPSAAMRHAGLWWAPRHGDVAEPTQSCVTPSRDCVTDLGTVRSELGSFKGMWRRRGGALAPRRTSRKRTPPKPGNMKLF
eukprot:scaffold21674_cov37-Phaeocystis_antarctica.AAC.1